METKGKHAIQAALDKLQATAEKNGFRDTPTELASQRTKPTPEWAEKLIAGRFPKLHIANLGKMRSDGLRKAEGIKRDLASGNALRLLCGDSGRGKTQICTFLAMPFKRPRYFAAFELIGKLAGRYSSVPEIQAEARQARIQAETADFLALDEYSQLKLSDHDERVFTALIDHRYRNQRPTVICANFTPEEASHWFPRPILSRLQECGKITHCDWQDYRASQCRASNLSRSSR